MRGEKRSVTSRLETIYSSINSSSFHPRTMLPVKPKHHAASRDTNKQMLGGGREGGREGAGGEGSLTHQPSKKEPSKSPSTLTQARLSKPAALCARHRGIEWCAAGLRQCGGMM